METRNRRRRQIGGDPCNCLRPLIRIWGVFTAIVVCGVGVDIAFHEYEAGYFIVSASIVIFFLELKWVVTIFIHLCTNTNNSDSITVCTKCWNVCYYFGGWRLSPPYIALGVALILWPHNLWLSHVAGVQLIILALLRLCLVFRFNASSKDENLLKHNNDESFEKYENLNEIVDDSLPEPISLMPSLEDEEALDEII